MNVPKLRFKGFDDEWKSIDLSKTFTYFSTNSLSREQLSNDGKIKNIHYGDIHRKFSTIVNVKNDVDTYIKDLNYNNRYELCKDYDLILADASEDYDGIGKAIEIINVTNDTISGLHTILARDVKGKFAPKFKGYYFNSPIIHNQMRILANGFKVYGISKDTINKLDVKIPSFKEQEKISNTLNLLDKKIELQSKKIEDLKLFKKGLDKIIFSNTDLFEEDIIKNRFLTDGGTALEEYISNKGTHKIISIGNYSTTGTYIDNGQKIILNDKTKTKLLDKNDLVMILNDKTTTGDIIGSSILIDENNKYIYNQRSQRLICKEINPKYAWCYLNNYIFRKRVFKLAQGGTQIYVNFSTIENQKILIPKNEKIEIMIVESIIGIKNKTDKEIKKLNGLIELKKGLVQNMFV